MASERWDHIVMKVLETVKRTVKFSESKLSFRLLYKKLYLVLESRLPFFHEFGNKMRREVYFALFIFLPWKFQISHLIVCYICALSPHLFKCMSGTALRNFMWTRFHSPSNSAGDFDIRIRSEVWVCFLESDRERRARRYEGYDLWNFFIWSTRRLGLNYWRLVYLHPLLQWSIKWSSSESILYQRLGWISQEGSTFKRLQ